MKRSVQIVQEYGPHLEEIVGKLKRGCVIAGDSDTVPGLLAELTQTGFEALNFVKTRFEKPYLILIDSPQKLAKFVEMPLAPEVERLMHACWPGPLTIIFKAKKELPAFLKSPEGTIAIRVPHHAGLLKLLAHFDGLFSTSANKSGEPVPRSVDELDPEILKTIAGVVRERISTTDKPSTIIECTQMPCKIIREGAYSKRDLEKILGRIE